VPTASRRILQATRRGIFEDSWFILVYPFALAKDKNSMDLLSTMITRG
jgi:hypothetical protein